MMIFSPWSSIRRVAVCSALAIHTRAFLRRQFRAPFSFHVIVILFRSSGKQMLRSNTSGRVAFMASQPVREVITERKPQRQPMRVVNTPGKRKGGVSFASVRAFPQPAIASRSKSGRAINQLVEPRTLGFGQFRQGQKLARLRGCRLRVSFAHRCPPLASQYSRPFSTVRNA